HVLDATRETRSQGFLLQKTITKRHLLDEPCEQTYNEDKRSREKTKLRIEVSNETQGIMANYENNTFLVPDHGKDNLSNIVDQNEDDGEDSGYNNDIGDKSFSEIIEYNKSKESKSGEKTHGFAFFNGIIDMSNVKEQINQKLKEEQLNWL
ncbi:20544_t:CDS:2, partial [Entrophospora sp. SA101]